MRDAAFNVQDTGCTIQAAGYEMDGRRSAVPISISLPTIALFPILFISKNRANSGMGGWSKAVHPPAGKNQFYAGFARVVSSTIKPIFRKYWLWPVSFQTEFANLQVSLSSEAWFVFRFQGRKAQCVWQRSRGQINHWQPAAGMVNIPFAFMGKRLI
jgi:hypothetical protein